MSRKQTQSFHATFRAKQGQAIDKSLPRLVIVGRPNVGKSTLFNRLVGKKLAIVDDQPGVTRDRREGLGRIADLDFRIIDTAGLDEGGEDTMNARMRAQTQKAVETASLVLFMIDARAGVTPLDQHYVTLLRRFSVPVVLLANKAEGKAGSEGLYESFTLGLGEPIRLSAEHGEGIGDLYEVLREHFPHPPEDEATEFATDEDAPAEKPNEDVDILGAAAVDTTKPLRIAIVGRPNAGKSTLINTFVGEERLLTGPEPGVTRDSIAIDLDWPNVETPIRKLKFYDTAGLRRKARIDDRVEKLAVSDTLRAIRFAEIVVVLMDATMPLEKQDLAIAGLVEQEGRALILGLNKWDLITDKAKTFGKLREEADRLLPQLRGMPLVPLSGLSGQGLEALVEAALTLEQSWSARLSTGRLNRWLATMVETTPPPAPGGRRIRLRYMTQVKSRPPLFVIFGTQLDRLPSSYLRFLTNGLRADFGFAGIPLRISLRNSQNPYAR